MQWIESDIKFLGYPCLKHGTHTTLELGLFGKYGYIWMNNEKECKAYIPSVNISNKYANGRSIITFPNADLHKWIKILKIPRSSTIQLRYLTID